MGGKAPAWVLLHGFAGAPASWTQVAAPLAARGAVLAPALMGHAHQPASAASFYDEIDRLAGVMADAGLAGAHLCGYSLGARVAFGLLVRHRPLFSGATLIGGHPGLAASDPARTDRAAADERWAEIAETAGAAEFARQWAGQPIFASQAGLAAAVQTEQQTIRQDHDGPGLARAMRALSLARMPDWRPHLATIDVPVTLMVGERDTKFRALATEALSLLPQARLIVVENAGHNVLLEAPEIVTSTLLAAHS
ncbi:MAG: alpha/beta fold hydrolase [Burkholderiaceae bacterium]